MYPSENITSFVAAFENETLPKDAWTHEAHLAVGLFYVLKYGREEALPKIRTNIKKFNIATGGENTDTEGYHETITVFWLWAIEQFLKEADASITVEDLFKQFVSHPYSNKNFPLEFYSKEYLMSTPLRLNCNDPDLKPMK